MALLEIRNIGWSVGGRTVVNQLSFSVNAGEIVALLGPNGAGTSSSFQIIMGLIHNHSGSVWLQGKSLEDTPVWQRVRRGMAYLPQQPVGFAKLSVRENLAIPLRKNKDKAQRITDLMNEFGLTRLADSPLEKLSGGERRKVDIARCLARKPAVILLDEPFAGLDPIASAELRSEVSHLAQRGLGVLITDHSAAALLQICSRVLIIDQGSCIADGPPDEVVNNPEVRNRYLGNGEVF